MIAYKSIDQDLAWLRKRSQEVDFTNKDFMEDIKILKSFCLEEDVFAMAAIQLGIDKRIIYLKNTDLEKIEDQTVDENIVLINPTILKREGIAWYYESCQSCLDNVGLVLRPYSLLVSYYDIEGKVQERDFIGFPAVVLSHELDHLDGILHIDKALHIYDMKVEERKELRKQYPYHVFSKEGDFEILEKEYTKMYKHNKLRMENVYA